MFSDKIKGLHGRVAEDHTPGSPEEGGSMTVEDIIFVLVAAMILLRR